MNNPRVVNWSWARVVPQLAALTLAIVTVHWLLPSVKMFEAFAVGAVAFLVYSYGSRFFIGRNHQRGIQAFRKGRFREAQEYYGRSIAFFERHPWVDRYRAITLMSPSTWSYREMGLLNRAFACAQLGDREGAVAGYETVLREYPKNEMAQQALTMMELTLDQNEQRR